MITCRKPPLIDNKTDPGKKPRPPIPQTPLFIQKSGPMCPSIFLFSTSGSSPPTLLGGIIPLWQRFPAFKKSTKSSSSNRSPDSSLRYWVAAYILPLPERRRGIPTPSISSISDQINFLKCNTHQVIGFLSPKNWFQQKYYCINQIKGPSLEKKLLFFWILSKLPPPLPPIWTTCTTFCDVKFQDLKVSFELKILCTI